MKLLHIASNKEGWDGEAEALVPVPDAYSKAEMEAALTCAEDLGVEEPHILAVYVVAAARPHHVLIHLDEFRVFIG